jgi:hypothetical protein
MRSISIFQQTNFTEPNFGSQVINFFQTADTIHYSFMFIALVCLILFSCLICCMCYIKCPTCLVRTLCCFANTCCLKKRVVTRDEEINRIREMVPMSNVNYQPVPQNPNVPNPAIQPYQVANPSAPPMSQPQQNQVHIHNCKNNRVGCFCIQGGQCNAALSGWSHYNHFSSKLISFFHHLIKSIFQIILFQTLFSNIGLNKPQ